MTELELNDFSLINFPKDKEVVVCSYGNIYQQETNFKIPLILEEHNKTESKHYVSYINLKDISNFPIGTIINNQVKMSEYYGNETLVSIDTTKKLESRMLYQIKELSKQITDESFPDKIDNFSSRYHVNSQYYFILNDVNTNKKIFIPHYEVARWFYFTTPSMTRQLLSGNLEEKSGLIRGLYKSITQLNESQMEILLTHNANSQDAPNIYRFATDIYANNSWYQVRRNLTAIANEIKTDKEKKGWKLNNKETKLKVDFPVKEVLNINARVKELEDGSLLVLKFINEDSTYDFDSLFVKLERKNKSIEPVGVIKKKNLKKSKLSKKITDENPSSDFEEVKINDTSFDKEERLGLLGKNIVKEVDYYDEKEIDNNNKDSNSEVEIDLSTGDSESTGDRYTGSATIENTDEDVQDETNYLTLQDFKDMLFECSKENDEFSYNILAETYLPQKPKNDLDKRSKWKKSKMSNGTTERKFIAVLLTYQNKNFFIFEIQRDKLVDGLSSLIIWDNDYSTIESSVIFSVARNFVKKNGSWLKDYEQFEFKKSFLEHPKGESNHDLKSWYCRLLDRLQ